MYTGCAGSNATRDTENARHRTGLKVKSAMRALLKAGKALTLVVPGLDSLPAKPDEMNTSKTDQRPTGGPLTDYIKCRKISPFCITYSI